jgi:predicted nuclease of predicted toxin-antitoxin system
MNIKLDENLPQTLVGALSRLGHDVDTVPAEGLAGKADAIVWRKAQQTGRFLITQDLDFSDIRQFRPGTHHGLLLVRLREPGRLALMTKLRTLFETEDTGDWPGCFVVLTDHKLRIRRPGKK